MKIERLLAIITMLLNKRRMSASELANHFEVSLRTIYRDLETINAAGIPIVAYPGSNGGYEIMESFTIDRQYLSLEELVTVIAALKGVQSSSAESQVGHLLEKIKTLATTGSERTGTGSVHPIIYDFNPWGSTKESMSKVSQLRRAIENKQRVSFLYTKIQGDSQERTVEPVTLILKGYVWYVYGYCLWRKSYRLFRLSRIADLTVGEETFTPHETTVDTLRWLEEWESVDQVSLVLEFSPNVHVRVKDMFRPNEVELRENGTLLVRTVASNDEWLHGMLLSFGEALTVIEPESIRCRIRDTVKKMTERYESRWNVDR
ncbi:YafY family protein [Brevibacillus choshinensis]|uniref:helix-turn-helix transcriptional regulator n=1 Tax=Brevibacillus choshinensis TaxID=54911 RepID=UPI002E200D05|nr:YafY family protein [Brevibacillus choshinensis]MED4750918.1 YafY family protein [Brevibacillus choshinensis]MED4783046.1 YafY family protein [Brevibacillus choshinensis]